VVATGAAAAGAGLTAAGTAAGLAGAAAPPTGPAPTGAGAAATGAAACRSSRWGWAVCIEMVSSDGVGDVVAWEMTLLHSVHWFTRAFEERADKHV